MFVIAAGQDSHLCRSCVMSGLVVHNPSNVPISHEAFKEAADWPQHVVPAAAGCAAALAAGLGPARTAQAALVLQQD